MKPHHSRRAPRRARTTALVTAAAMLTASCGTSSSDPQAIGVKRRALSVSFESEDTRPEGLPDVFGDDSLALPDLAGGGSDISTAPVRTPAPGIRTRPFPGIGGNPGENRAPDREPDQCPPARPGAVPAITVSETIGIKPTSGNYPHRATGSIEVQLDGQTAAKVAYPATPVWTITDPQVTATDEAGAETVRYELIRRLGARTEIRDVLEYDDTALRLVSRTNVHGDREHSFTPAAPIVLVTLGAGEAEDPWRDSAYDPAAQRSMTTQGRYAGRERVDVCGVVHDTYRIELWETTIDLIGGRTVSSGTGPQPDRSLPGIVTRSIDDPNSENRPLVINLAPQLGGQILRIEADGYVEHVPNDDQDGVTTLVFDYVSTSTTTSPATGGGS